MEFECECNDPACRELTEMTGTAFQELRDRFPAPIYAIVAHETGEEVVLIHDDFLVVKEGA